MKKIIISLLCCISFGYSQIHEYEIRIDEFGRILEISLNSYYNKLILDPYGYISKIESVISEPGQVLDYIGSDRIKSGTDETIFRNGFVYKLGNSELSYHWNGKLKSVDIARIDYENIKNRNNKIAKIGSLIIDYDMYDRVENVGSYLIKYDVNTRKIYRIINFKKSHTECKIIVINNTNSYR